MAASTDLTTKAACKTKMGISGTDDDDFIDALIDECSEKIELYLGRKFAKAQYTEYFDPDDCPDGVIKVSNPPINKNSADLVRTQSDVETYITVHQDTTREWSSSLGAVDDANLYVIPTAGIIRSAVGFAEGDYFGSIKVVYYGGYATIPDALAHACEAQVAEWFQMDTEAAWGKSSESEGGASVSWHDHGDLSPKVLDMLELFDLRAE